MHLYLPDETMPADQQSQLFWVFFSFCINPIFKWLKEYWAYFINCTLDNVFKVVIYIQLKWNQVSFTMF